MARQRRTLDEQIADLSMRGRTARTETLSVPAMAPLGPTLIADNAILNEHLSPGSVALDNLDDSMQETLTALAGNETAIEEARARLEAEAKRIDSLIEEVEAGAGGVSEEEVEAVVIREAVLKKIAAGTASFQHADIGNLTATGTSHLSEAVIQKLYADVVLSREVVADRVKAGAVDGQRIVGASIETSDELDKGVKLSDAGMVAHGKTTRTEVTYPGVPAAPVTYNNRARLTQLPVAKTDEVDDVYPGLWFEAEREDGLVIGVRPEWRAGVTTSDAAASGVSIQSASDDVNHIESAVFVNPGGVTLTTSRTSGSGPGGINSSRITTGATWTHMQTVGYDGITTATLTMGGGGVSVGHGTGDDRRIPVGLLARWVNTTALNIVNNTQILNTKVRLPGNAWVRMNVVLRGSGNVDNQYTALMAYANGVLFGESTNYQPKAWLGTDIRVSFLYKSTSAYGSEVNFRLVGSNVMPATQSTYVIPKGATAAPTIEITFEDLGDMPL